jgi:hypothetical protein
MEEFAETGCVCGEEGRFPVLWFIARRALGSNQSARGCKGMRVWNRRDRIRPETGLRSGPFWAGSSAAM